MKRLLVSMLVCALVCLNLLVATGVQAQPLPARPAALSTIALPTLPLAEAAAPAKDLLKQLETEVLPQLENILTPEQRDQFKTAIADGTSFRKAFKSLTLTPAQKDQLKTLLKALPKQDAFASLTPAEKKKLFMQNKGLFMPTSAEITDKINAGMKQKEAFQPTSQKIKDKIDTSLKQKETGMPTLEAIGEKIAEKMNLIKSKMED